MVATQRHCVSIPYSGGGGDGRTAASPCSCTSASNAWLNAATNPLPGVRTAERFVLEKPFGRDTDSCQALTRELSM